MIAQLRLDIFIADFNTTAVLIAEATALASGPEGAGFAGVLRTNAGAEFAGTHLAGNRHHMINGLETTANGLGLAGMLVSYSAR